MDLTSIPIMAALKRKMGWLHQNQNVISQNIANADTPGYRAKELQEQDFSSLVDGLSAGPGKMQSSNVMRTTNARHMNSSGGTVGSDAALKEQKGSEESLNGNSVVLEEESMKMANTQMQYSMVVKLYKKNVDLLKAAMGKGGGGGR